MQDQITISEEFNENEKIVIDELKILSVNRFIVLCLFSLNLYFIWWTYKVWRFFKDKENADMLPAARAIFGIFFWIPLFNRILNFAKSNGYQEKYYSVVIYIGILGFNLLGRLPEPFWLISLFSMAFFIPPLNAFNFALANSPDVEVEVQHSFNKRQTILILIGAVIWFFALLGFLLMLLGIE